MIGLVPPGEDAGQWTLEELPASTDVEPLIQIFIKCCCAIWNQIQNFSQRERGEGELKFKHCRSFPTNVNTIRSLIPNAG